ncbi:MAG: ComF family protein [Roseitalea sp.]|nr:ComF family protein [Roseitalea sp.]MBO6722598.1 ComF family protein [Roseitalea sp.]MBO6745113.1 ComF family protein [Roseitalea sp.]
MGRFRQWAIKAGRATGAVLFPDACLSCGRHVARHGTLCADCWSGIAFIEQPLCAVSGAPFTHDFGGRMVSADVLANPPLYDKARAACVHSGVARQLVTRLKYGDRTDLAPWMARFMARAGAELIAEAEVIVPVPLHRVRFWRRRFNQAAELARALAAGSDLPMAAGALTRKKRTRPQVGLTANQRQVNVRGVFSVPASQEIAVAGRRVLLIDDVLTTGATIDSAAKTLKKAGATAVTVLTFSRVVPGRRDPATSRH